MVSIAEVVTLDSLGGVMNREQMLASPSSSSIVEICGDLKKMLKMHYNQA